IWVICRREFAAYFMSPIAYVAISVFLVVVGIKFFVVDEFFEVGQASLRSLFELLPIFFLFYLPAISMRLVAEEKRSGTFELVMTLPVTDGQLILGKYLGALGFLVVTLLLTLVYPILILALGNPDSGIILGSYLGVLLLGAAYLAIGIMTSAWTTNQIVGYVLGAVLSALLFFQDQLVGMFWGGARRVLEYASLGAHYLNFTRGVVDLRDLVFFLSVIVFALLVATFSMTSRRWS
ncbi:MAG: ABC transporter permease, partial [Deltaproteobacteria bacterium]|nr:ABC transporter permease [Deltaproteobacteria bacterium]